MKRVLKNHTEKSVGWKGFFGKDQQIDTFLVNVTQKWLKLLNNNNTITTTTIIPNNY